MYQMSQSLQKLAFLMNMSIPTSAYLLQLDWQLDKLVLLGTYLQILRKKT